MKKKLLQFLFTGYAYGKVDGRTRVVVSLRKRRWQYKVQEVIVPWPGYVRNRAR